MKTLNKIGFLTLALSTSALWANVLNIQVAPKTLKGSVEVLGFQVEASGEQAILLAGNAASNVAQAGGVAFKKSSEMLIVTGDAASTLVANSLNGVAKTGEYAYVSTKAFTQSAYDLSINAVQTGTAKVYDIGSKATATTRAIAFGVADSSGKSVSILADSGLKILENGANFVKGLLDLLLP
ncbi:MAG: hypothetical protein KA116_04790 [Proteobacteria bacterium]|nr:hypothetical protein [Pseudomonadota bacterium]